MQYKCPKVLQNKRLICLDLQTDGLNILLNTIIEIGVIEVISGKIQREYTTLFGGGRSSMFLVRKIHHIKDCDRIGKQTFKQRAKKLSEYLSDSIIITHNGTKFDIPMLNQKFSQVGVMMQNVKFIDTYLLAKSIGQFESNSLQFLSKKFDIKYGSHRGLGDAYSTLQLLYAFMQKYGEKIFQMKGWMK